MAASAILSRSDASLVAPDDRDLESLAGLGHVVAEYNHRDKLLTPGAVLALPAARLKWYDLAPTDAAVPTEIHQRARDFISRETEEGRFKLEGDLGFVVLHRCGAEFYFLLISTWRNENELWQTVCFKPNDVTPDFSLFPQPGAHRGTYCVWELGAVWREQQAWKRFLRSPRDNAARRVYLDDIVSGPV